MVTTLTKKEMRQQVEEYKSRIHPTKKYRSETLVLLCDMWKISQRKKIDLWDQLDDLKHIASTDKVNGNVVKSAFRKFLQECQDNRCCYCNKVLVNIAHAKPIEHILPRFKYPQFSLHFWNLALSCFDCNLTKLKDVWGSINPDSSVYPSQFSFSDMFHPRFHLYSDHVEYVCVENNGCSVTIYKGITAQGKHLCLNLLNKVAAKRIIIENNDELHNAMSDIQGYQQKIDGIDETALGKFAEFLNDSVLAFLDY